MSARQDNVKQPAWDVSTAWEEWQAARIAGDADAEIVAMRRWSEAQTNASIGLVGQIVRPLAEQIANARTADLDWRTEERTTRDAQSTRLYAELDQLHNVQAGLAAAVAEAVRGLGGMIPRIDAIEAGQDALVTRVSDIGEDLSGVKGDVAVMRDEFGQRFVRLETRVGTIERVIARIELAQTQNKIVLDRIDLWTDDHPTPDDLRGAGDAAEQR